MGIIKKFFFTNNPHDFITWHNFDCGWREEKPYGIKNKKELTKRKYFRLNYYQTPIKIKMEKHNLCWNKSSFIRVKYHQKEGFRVYPTCISVGDTIVISRGSYLTIRQAWTSTKHYNYIYYYVKRIAS